MHVRIVLFNNFGKKKAFQIYHLLHFILFQTVVKGHLPKTFPTTCQPAQLCKLHWNQLVQAAGKEILFKINRLGFYPSISCIWT